MKNYKLGNRILEQDEHGKWTQILLDEQSLKLTYTHPENYKPIPVIAEEHKHLSMTLIETLYPHGFHSKPVRMTGNEYQELAARTLVDDIPFELDKQQRMAIWNATGLAGEAGEVSELIKKGIFHQQGLDPQKLKKELGDVMWYLSCLAGTYGITLEEIMTANINKLKARYPEGFDVDNCMNREGDAG